MAREIHDTIAQGLTAILTQLEALDTDTDTVHAGDARADDVSGGRDDGGGGDMRGADVRGGEGRGGGGKAGDVRARAARLATVRALARESLTEARRSVQALRPAPLAEARLAPALSDVAEKWSQAAGVPVTVSITGEARPLHAEVELTLLRVAQEALANVAKHAAAGRVGVTLSYMEDVVVLDVRDDGRGFTPDGETTSPSNDGVREGAWNSTREGTRSSVREVAGNSIEQSTETSIRQVGEGGFGLVSMRQRVTRLAGSFAIETAPGQGTGISATVPAIPAAADSEA
ncbi:hypothetical protein HII36_18010 [Nonomuraea sp. NN258]|nr:hypothetical protein [Nonomuraea antri]